MVFLIFNYSFETFVKKLKLKSLMKSATLIGEKTRYTDLVENLKFQVQDNGTMVERENLKQIFSLVTDSSTNIIQNKEKFYSNVVIKNIGFMATKIYLVCVKSAIEFLSSGGGFLITTCALSFIFITLLVLIQQKKSEQDLDEEFIKVYKKILNIVIFFYAINVISVIFINIETDTSNKIPSFYSLYPFSLSCLAAILLMMYYVIFKQISYSHCKTFAEVFLIFVITLLSMVYTRLIAFYYLNLISTAMVFCFACYQRLSMNEIEEDIKNRNQCFKSKSITKDDENENIEIYPSYKTIISDSNEHDISSYFGLETSTDKTLFYKFLDELEDQDIANMIEIDQENINYNDNAAIRYINNDFCVI